ncbi:hypothetical protein CDAR_508081 [Caerostris darwini]|uniref:Protein-cysteine N-palmitoyltransferase Rasp n=1 Tax=Caerostris darwini TaxID=1538125 RepID=A0AAV4WUC3_9ARAC|nr:hypothetical protein CDAR_508081 [Caerostris darwini]
MKIERIFHWLIWSFSIFYSLYNFKNSCEYHPNISPEDFIKGWSILHPLMKDNSDIEWVYLTSTFKKYYVFFLFQVAGTQILSRITRTIIPYFYTLLSLTCLTFILGYQTALAFILYPVCMFIIHTRGKKAFCYILTITSLLLIHHPQYHILKRNFTMGVQESFLFDVALAWLILKSLSFAIDRIDAKVYKNVEILDFCSILAYSLYLPVVFTGPVINYETFHYQMLKTAHPLSLKELILRICHLLKIILWYFVYEFLLHFIYSSAVQFYPHEVKNFDSWALCGLGYALPMMFFLKYFVTYGVPKAIAKLEDIELPPPPKCISCIHLSSFLWRHFDRGLYLWLLRYLYYPAINNEWTFLRKIHALCLCFGFVCLWHGMDKSICLSSAINCALVVSEILTKFLLTTKVGHYFEKIPAAMRSRISAAFATPHFLMMCISCCFFLSNFDIGMLLIKRTILGDIIPLGPLLLIMYCGCHVSMDMYIKREKKKRI